MRKIAGVIILLVLTVSMKVSAQSAPVEIVSAEEIATSAPNVFVTIPEMIPGLIEAVTQSPAFSLFTKALFITCALTLIGFAVNDYINGTPLKDMLEMLVKIGSVWILMENYITVLSALNDWQRSLGGVIQLAITGNANEFFALDTIINVWDALDFQLWEGDTFSLTAPWRVFARFFADIGMLFVLVVLLIILMLLILATAVATLLASFGFFVVGAIGLSFIPLALFKPLEFLFNGWLRTLFTVLLYSVMSKLVLSLSAIGFQALLGINPLTLTKTPIIITTNSWDAILSIVLWGVISLAATQQIIPYSQAIVSGVGAAMGDKAAMTAVKK